MSRVIWDAQANRTYETGVSHGVLYPKKSGAYTTGVVWDGLTSVTQSPSGAEPTPIYADNIKFLTLVSAEEFGATIEAFLSPAEFDECDGSFEPVPGVYIGQQNRIPFGFTYQTRIGNGDEGTAHGYKIHIVYEALAAPSERAHTTINDSPEAMTLSWEMTTTPVTINTVVDGKILKPTSLMTFDSTKIEAAKLKALEDILYGKDPTTEGGSDGVEPRLPSPDEIITLMTTSG